LEKAATLDPKNANVLLNLCYSYTAQRNFEAADKTVDRLIATSPQSFQARAFKAFIALQLKGDLSMAEKVFSSMPPDTDPGLMTLARFWILRLKRNFPEALQVLQQFRGEILRNSSSGPCPKVFLEGEIYRLLGDEAKARTAFEHARIISDQLLGAAPANPERHGQHGLILAGLGQKQEAIAEGKRAVELLPESEDAFDGPQITATLAQIYAWTGEFDEAFRLLDHLLVVPNGLNVPMLKLDPAWDQLRKDPRFQTLIDKYSPKT